ncbi:MAG: right-handed parallel beta-helix repeat-containing protein [Angelakisella sp.]
MLAVMLPVTAMADDTPTLGNDKVWQNVNSNNVQALLDGEYGSIDNSTIVLTAGTYGRLELGRATKHPGSNTTYTCPHNDPNNDPTAGGGPVSFTKVEDYIAHMTKYPHHGDARTFTRTMSNLTITAQEEADVTVEGLTLLARTYRDAKDPFVTSTEKDYIGYDIDLVVNDLAFSNIKFTGKVEIASENRDNTIIDGVTFENCKFETNDIATINGQAINFSNNVNNGQVKNLIVKNCDFTNCYQGVYTNQVRNVSVTGCTFNTTGHNAIAIQDSGVCDHGNVVITGNTFKNVGDRIIRFNSPAKGTVITITKNTAVNSGKM